jgi:hypothetical protein
LRAAAADGASASVAVSQSESSHKLSAGRLAGPGESSQRQRAKTPVRGPRSRFRTGARVRVRADCASDELEGLALWQVRGH